MKKAEKVIREAEEKAAKKAEERAMKKADEKAYQEKVNMVIEMINQNCLNDFIQIITKMPLEEIEKIREEHTEQ